MYIDVPDWQTYTIRLTLPEDLLSSVHTSETGTTAYGDKLYLICKPDRHTKTLLGYIDRGICFKIVKEETAYMVLAFKCSFSYTVTRASHGTNATNDAAETAQNVEVIDNKVDLRLKCGK